MKALLCKEFTAVENLTWEDVPDPYPQDGEVILLHPSKQVKNGLEIY